MLYLVLATSAQNANFNAPSKMIVAKRHAHIAVRKCLWPLVIPKLKNQNKSNYLQRRNNGQGCHW